MPSLGVFFGQALEGAYTYSKVIIQCLLELHSLFVSTGAPLTLIGSFLDKGERSGEETLCMSGTVRLPAFELCWSAAGSRSFLDS